MASMTISYQLVWMIVLHGKVGEKGQVVIPKPIRDMFGINPKDKVSFTVKKDRIIIETLDPRKLLDDYLIEIEIKEKEPERIDWDREFYGQFGG